MAKLFGLDIAGIVNREIANAGGVLSGTLTRVSPGARTPGSLSGGTNPAETSHAFKGFLEQGERRIKGQLQTVSGTFLSILGASVAGGVVPAVNDRAVIEGAEYDLVEQVARDPAAALYVFRVEL